MSNFDDVGTFMKTFNQEVKTHPELPDIDTVKLRMELIHEEVRELIEGLEKNDIVNVAKELTDILYVVYGAGHAFGIDLDACFAEVQASNMSKLDDEGQPIYREDGKVLKSDSYIEPDLETILFGEVEPIFP